jgi:hypothetical protein
MLPFITNYYNKMTLDKCMNHLIFGRGIILDDRTLKCNKSTVKWDMFREH